MILVFQRACMMPILSPDPDAYSQSYAPSVVHSTRIGSGRPNERVEGGVIVPSYVLGAPGPLSVAIVPILADCNLFVIMGNGDG